MQPITYTIDELIAHKESGAVTPELLEKLRAEADKILAKPISTVLDIKLPRPSGDPHDFVSMGPYWWPNPDTPDGLPWVNRDGYVNPDTRTGVGPGYVYGVIHLLALAAFYLGDNGYSDYANRQLYTWFINPETRMNPNGKFAQGIPGICEGRGTGLIGFSQSYLLFNGIAVLDSLGLMDAEVIAGVRKWMVEFTDWMLTHPYGLDADNAGNNHGSWHDANVLSMAVFTERSSLVKNICLTSYHTRIVSQTTPLGEQPRELRRATAIGYTFYNLTAQMVVANIAERLGYEAYWGIDESRGKCILRSAVDYIYPYAINPESFPYSELHPESRRVPMRRYLLSVAKRYPAEGYEEKAEPLNDPLALSNLEPAI